jgi:hypothetical protein
MERGVGVSAGQIVSVGFDRARRGSTRPDYPAPLREKIRNSGVLFFLDTLLADRCGRSLDRPLGARPPGKPYYGNYLGKHFTFYSQCGFPRAGRRRRARGRLYSSRESSWHPWRYGVGPFIAPARTRISLRYSRSRRLAGRRGSSTSAEKSGIEGVSVQVVQFFLAANRPSRRRRSRYRLRVPGERP